MTEGISTINGPVFDGDEEKFQSWWIRYQAYNRVKRFSTALKINTDLTEDEVMIKTLDATNEDESKKIVAGKRNVLAMAHLTMALVTEALMKKVNTVCTDEWPDGLAYELIGLLKE